MCIYDPRGTPGQRTQSEIKGNVLTASIPESLQRDGKEQTSLCRLGWNSSAFESLAVLGLLVVDLLGELVLGLPLSPPAGSSPCDL